MILVVPIDLPRMALAPCRRTKVIVTTCFRARLLSLRLSDAVGYSVAIAAIEADGTTLIRPSRVCVPGGRPGEIPGPVFCEDDEDEMFADNAGTRFALTFRNVTRRALTLAGILRFAPLSFPLAVPA